MEEKVNSGNSEVGSFDVKDIYTPLSVAKEEIWRRLMTKRSRKAMNRPRMTQVKEFRDMLFVDLNFDGGRMFL